MKESVLGFKYCCNQYSGHNLKMIFTYFRHQYKLIAMKYLIVLFLLMFSIISNGQNDQFKNQDISINKYIDGTLLELENSPSSTLAIIIAGSGPTDRNGNQNFMKNNALKSLAEELLKNNIATFRYDKRIVKQILKGKVDKNIKFDDFVTDVESIVDYFRENSNYKTIVLIGHSQGSLVAMLAAKDRADAVVSLAGAGQDISQVITEQVSKTAPFFTDDTKRIFSIMKSGKTTSDYPPALASVFNIELQPFMMNWMQYNPSEIIANLDMPILIINGTKDLQVPVEEANMLHNANPKSEIVLIENMNHVLFTIEGDDLENAKSYNEGFRKINPDLILAITDFISKVTQ